MLWLLSLNILTNPLVATTAGEMGKEKPTAIAVITGAKEMRQPTSTLSFGLLLTLALGCTLEDQEVVLPTQYDAANASDVREPDAANIEEASTQRAALERIIAHSGGPPLDDHIEVAPGVFLLEEALADGSIRYKENGIDPQQVTYAARAANACEAYDWEFRQGYNASGHTWQSLALGVKQTNGDVGFFGQVTASSQQAVTFIAAGANISINGQHVGYISDNAYNGSGPAIAQGTWFAPCTNDTATFEIESGFMFYHSASNNLVYEEEVIELPFSCCPP